MRYFKISSSSRKWSKKHTKTEYGDFSPEAIQDFRSYLKAKYSSKQLIDLGISHIDTFDYAALIRNHYKETLNLTANRHISGITFSGKPDWFQGDSVEFEYDFQVSAGASKNK